MNKSAPLLEDAHSQGIGRWDGYCFPPRWNPLAEYLTAKCQIFVAQTAKLGPNSLVLDIGSGWGRDPLWYAICGYNIVAIEVDPKFLKAIRDNYKKTKTHNTAAIIRADAQHLPFKEDTFDLVCSRALLHHIPNIPKMMKGTYRVLKKGKMMISCTEPNNLNPFWHLAKFLTRTFHLKSYALASGEFTEKNPYEPLVRPFCRWQLTAYLKHAGFSRVKSGKMWLPYTTYNETYFKAWILLEKLIEKTFIPYVFGQLYVFGTKTS